MTNTALIAACPFCGSHDTYLSSSGVDSQFCACNGCGAEGPPAPTRFKATQLWEGRQAPAVGTRYRDADGNVASLVMPARLDAEGGYKAALMGEFTERSCDCCLECHGDGEDEAGEPCKACNGSGEVTSDIYVSWDNIKRIHEAAVAVALKR